MDTRGAGRPEEGRRRLLGSDLAEAMVQHLRGPSPGGQGCDRALGPALLTTELLELHRPLVGTHGPHRTAPQQDPRAGGASPPQPSLAPVDTSMPTGQPGFRGSWDRAIGRAASRAGPSGPDQGEADSGHHFHEGGTETDPGWRHAGQNDEERTHADPTGVGGVWGWNVVKAPRCRGPCAGQAH